MNLFCIGISHHTAPVETRERYAPQIPAAWILSDATGCAEALLLRTCNRVEVYAVSAGHVSTEAIARFLAGESDTQGEAPFYRYEKEECVRHLFRVTSGLDSMV